MCNTKICSRCKEEKLLTSDFFYKNKSHNTGFKIYCKICCSKYQSDFYIIKENKEKRLNYFKSYSENILKKNNPDYNKFRYNKYKNTETYKKNSIKSARNRVESMNINYIKKLLHLDINDITTELKETYIKYLLLKRKLKKNVK